MGTEETSDRGGENRRKGRYEAIIFDGVHLPYLLYATLLREGLLRKEERGDAGLHL